MARKLTGFGGPLIDMQGAIDMHVHSHPDIFPRLGDDIDLVTAARDAGLRAMVIKCHHENTVSRSYFANGTVEGIDVFGGIVLNSYVGFANPAAVEVALKLGGKFVWMPTVDAAYHAEVHGGTGTLVGLSGGRVGGPTYTVLDDAGELKPEVVEILGLIAEHDGVLATSHLSYAEIKPLIVRAKAEGVANVVITHPFYKAPGLNMEQLKELVDLGGIAELGYCDYSAMWHVGFIEEVVEAVNVLGAENCVLVSDCGQRHNPLPSEALRVYAQTVFEKGVSEEDVYTMIRDVPARILGLDSGARPPRPTVPYYDEGAAAADGAH